MDRDQLETLFWEASTESDMFSTIRPLFEQLAVGDDISYVEAYGQGDFDGQGSGHDSQGSGHDGQGDFDGQGSGHDFYGVSLARAPILVL